MLDNTERPLIWEPDLTRGAKGGHTAPAGAAIHLMGLRSGRLSKAERALNALLKPTTCSIGNVVDSC